MDGKHGPIDRDTIYVLTRQQFMDIATQNFMSRNAAGAMWVQLSMLVNQTPQPEPEPE